MQAHYQLGRVGNRHPNVALEVGGGNLPSPRLYKYIKRLPFCLNHNCLIRNRRADVRESDQVIISCISDDQVRVWNCDEAMLLSMY